MNARAVGLRRYTADADFEEKKHPRGKGGQFTSGAGSSGSAPTKEIPEGASTEEVWRDLKTKNWHPDREAWHQSITENALHGKESPQGRAPLALIMGGGTASGKTTVAKKVGAANENAVHVDADAIRNLIPEYEKFKAIEKKTASARVHEEASYLAKLTLAKAIAAKKDLIYDATSSGKNAQATAMLVNKLASEGYDVHALFVDVDLAVAQERAESRANNKKSESFGRYVPSDVLEKTHSGAAANFMLMKESSLLKSAKLYGNNGDHPEPIWSRENKEEPNVHDKEAWKSYQHKASSGI
jgi:predicted kinase